MEQTHKNHAYHVILLGIVSAFLTIPMFLFLYKFFPSISFTVSGHLIRLDHIILFMAVFFILYFLLKKLRVLVYILVFSGMVVLTITNFSDVYTLENLYHDYSSFLYNISSNSLNQKFLKRELEFKQEDLIRDAINYKDPEVRNYAVNVANKYFVNERHLSKNQKWVHFFSIFKEINSKWDYIYDPLHEEYYASASETINQLSFDDRFKGDCDDHSILMAALIKAVGGEVRLVRTRVTMSTGQEVGHLYPEVKFGDTKDLENVVYLIKNIYFKEETRGKNVFYYQDTKGFIWLNFDYNDAYPGSKYQSDIRLSEIEI